jgi:hypothetical protein
MIHQYQDYVAPDNRLINECRGVDGMRTDAENESTL